MRRWTNAKRELSLEPPPPLAVLAAHQPPATENGESPFSRLLDARWADLALAHLKDQEDYLAKRRNIGKDAQNTRGGTTEDQGDAEPKGRARPKAKPKAQPAGAAREG